MKNAQRNNQMQINTASMADIAFLLLIFFMITTTIVNDKGLSLLLPPEQSNIVPVEIHEKNLFKIQVNSDDKIMVEGETRENLHGIRHEISEFILNYGRNKALSESPEKAIVSIKTNRGTSQEMFIKVLDEVKAAYYQIYADRTGLTPAEYRNLYLSIPEKKRLFEKGRKGIPMNISIAEPSN
ncbi:hypothetical protein C900_05596 [Fulvivirga imtechensis AK7]|uniref:Biopolymer transporter ExbD n=1 Tax=Fulvivirga imtechensis AK7 TaxID=1237149 RepID=L8JL05_9BACT|nr:biopolymer transporter ExbD [Fulvivirga imtechensis]ELR68903.1 hypothetical protein C900_05596 [Fulvivirga imtechensis AK7]